MASHSAAQGQTRYVYDASGQRTIKINADGSSHIFSYNQQGQLLFEGRYNAAKQLHSQRHYIWLNDTPVGFVVKDNNSDNNVNNNGDWNIYAIHTDHLNTPRLVTNQNGAEVWRWASDAFGQGDAVGSIEFNLRFPGQYYDAESSLHYNYFRDYNAQTGRYVQSDPIGLAGGLNTYVYAGSNPVMYIDPLGLMDIGGWEHAVYPASMNTQKKPLTFRHHGNWGGPGWAAGEYKAEKDLSPDDFKVETKGPRGECYKAHDYCINQSENQCSDKPISSCDHGLASCLRRISPLESDAWRTDTGVPLPAKTEALFFDTLIPWLVH